MDQPVSIESSFRKYWRIFFRGWLHVALVSFNMWQIANGKIMGAVLVGFCISLVWTCNVRTAAFGSWYDRITYCLGAALGTYCGLMVPTLIY
jgi:hypothetical protein